MAIVTYYCYNNVSGATLGLFPPINVSLGLTANTTYHYRGYAVNSDNDADASYSPDATFTTTSFHAACANNECIEVNGSGTDECTIGTSCVSPSNHSACIDNSCVLVNGSGTNGCISNASCTNPIDGACDDTVYYGCSDTSGVASTDHKVYPSTVTWTCPGDGGVPATNCSKANTPGFRNN